MPKTSWAAAEKNWRCPEGEIDLVAVDGATLVVVEVKTRSSVDFGHPFEAIGPDKVARLASTDRSMGQG